MADLDDFFAKKDRKKKTASKKFATTEEVAKKLEDTAKKTEKQKKEPRSEGGDDTNPQPHEQDEWKEFEEEKKDYTGLKIGNLTLNPNQENVGHQESGSGEQQEGQEHGQDADRKSGPWNRMDTAHGSESEEVPVPPPKAAVVEKPASATEPSGGQKSAYRVPQMRNLNATSAPQARLRGMRGAAPDIHNEDFFPTLSGKRRSGEGAFEVVQQHRASSYNRQQMEQSRGSGGPKLSLGNRYNTLSTNES